MILRVNGHYRLRSRSKCQRFTVPVFQRDNTTLDIRMHYWTLLSFHRRIRTILPLVIQKIQVQALFSNFTIITGVMMLWRRTLINQRTSLFRASKRGPCTKFNSVKRLMKVSKEFTTCPISATSSLPPLSQEIQRQW